MAASPPVPPDAALAVRTICDLEGLDALRPDWDRLAAEAPATTTAHTYAYARAGWDTRRPNAERLHVVTARLGGRLVAVWPLYVSKRGGVRAVRHLGCGGREEYGEPLIAADCPQRDVVARQIYEAACKGADVLEIYNLSQVSPVRPLLEARRRVAHIDEMCSPVVSLGDAGGWDAWLAAKSRSFRSGLRYDRRRLAALGPLVFREVAREDAAGFVGWLMAAKGRWLDERKIGDSWLRDPHTARFFAALVGQAQSGVHGFALESDGRRVAGGICLASASTVEFYVSGLDRGFALYSAGNLLIEDLARWCAGRGLDLDFRLTRDPYKLRWSDRDEAYTTYVLACTPRGALVVRRLMVRALVIRLKTRLKRLLRR